jgi:hypothetical protein
MSALSARYSFGMFTIHSAALRNRQFESTFFTNINLTCSHIVTVYHNISLLTLDSRDIRGRLFKIFDYSALQKNNVFLRQKGNDGIFSIETLKAA